MGRRKIIAFKKRYYGVQKALAHLDEEFEEFGLSQIPYEKFIREYSEYFYEISGPTHAKFLVESIKYAYPDGYVNPLQEQKLDLKNKINEIKREIDSLEKQQFYFRNNNFIMDKEFENLTNGMISAGQQIFFIQSGRLREIKHFPTYMNLKNRIFKHKGEIADQEIVLFVSTDTLNGLPKGPDINSLKDAQISNLEINIYPMTLSEYEENNPIIELI